MGNPGGGGGAIGCGGGGAAKTKVICRQKSSRIPMTLLVIIFIVRKSIKKIYFSK